MSQRSVGDGDRKFKNLCVRIWAVRHSMEVKIFLL